MSSAVQASVIAIRRCALGPVAWLALVAALPMLAGCGDKKAANKPASQAAVKVNKEEITVHQINFVLSQQRALAPEQAASAAKQVLERLIDQEVAMQKAMEQNLDRDPRVLQQLDASRREILARAYIERVGAGAPKPIPAEIKAYYDAHPALFKERKMYSMQEIAIEAKPDQIATLRDKLAQAKDIQDFLAFMKASDIKFAGNQAVRTAEQLPLASLDRFAAMKDGERLFNQTPRGAQVLVLVGTRSQPVDEEQATPAIEQFLLNERKRKIVEEDLKALRAAAKIQYLGEYAKGAATAIDAPVTAASEAPVMPALAPSPVVAAPSAAPQLDMAAPAEQMASAPPAAALENGIKGLK